jgi:hypothetical protein
MSSEIHPIRAWEPKSTQGLSVACELPLSCWYCQMFQRYNPATTAIPGCNRYSPTGGRCYQQGIASVFR